MHYQNLPDALKQQKHFCLWKREMRKGNYTKVPYQTNGARARPNDLSTFTDFTSVLSTYNGGEYDGIGLLNDDLVGLDCDDCVNDDGTLTDLAVEVINTVDSYAEYSPVRRAKAYAYGRGQKTFPMTRLNITSTIES